MITATQAVYEFENWLQGQTASQEMENDQWREAQLYLTGHVDRFLEDEGIEFVIESYQVYLQMMALLLSRMAQQPEGVFKVRVEGTGRDAFLTVPPPSTIEHFLSEDYFRASVFHFRRKQAQPRLPLV